MLRDINDTEEDAQRLADLTADLACKVNLITFNPHQGTRFQPSPMEQVLAFRCAALLLAGCLPGWQAGATDTSSLAPVRGPLLVVAGPAGASGTHACMHAGRPAVLLAVLTWCLEPRLCSWCHWPHSTAQSATSSGAPSTMLPAAAHSPADPPPAGLCSSRRAACAPSGTAGGTTRWRHVGSWATPSCPARRRPSWSHRSVSGTWCRRDEQLSSDARTWLLSQG
jgi:hypothetical protein